MEMTESQINRAMKKVLEHLCTLWQKKGPTNVTLKDLKDSMNECFGEKGLKVTDPDAFFAKGLGRLLLKQSVIIGNRPPLQQGKSIQPDWNEKIQPGVALQTRLLPPPPQSIIEMHVAELG